MTVIVKSTAWPYRVKEPIDSGAVLNYGIDWGDWLPEGATIQSATWTVTGGSVVYSAVVDGVTYIWLSVTSGATKVRATVHIILDTAPVALEDERTLVLVVKER
jgi:hypothetical protein